jgi:solute carrier family 35 (UDP-xylose/UDP-N-acetylglucosamine transporter), member B4
LGVDVFKHSLSLPIFLFLIPDIKQGFWSLNSGNGTSALVSFLILGGNLVSQLVCVSGVNRLSSVRLRQLQNYVLMVTVFQQQVSSVSTNLVLTTRKALSLCLSVWWFGSGWNIQLGIGAAMVFVGSLLFTVAGERKSTKDD